jgi:molybdenum cofactor guanylyltransferase
MLGLEQFREMIAEAKIPLTALILAGGQSLRMGQDKALIPVEGVPMIQQVYDIAHSCAEQVKVITPWIERYQNVLPEDCQFVREESLPNDVITHGPLVGFAQGLATVESTWVLLLACDMPLLQGDIIQNWRSHLLEVPNEAIAALPRRSEIWEPLCGFYRRQCLSSLTHFIEQGGRSFQRWLAQHPIQELPLPEPEMLFNCNTPEDLYGLQDV